MKDWCLFFFKFFLDFTSEAMFIEGSFLIINSISLVVIGLLRSSISSCAFLGMYAFHLGYMTYCHTMVCSIPLSPCLFLQGQ